MSDVESRKPFSDDESSLPPMPALDRSNADLTSVDLSEHRTKLSRHRTVLSDHRTEMSMRRTGMSFQRTRMSAERTLMSIIRTSLSLISFGFTIAQFFQKLHESEVVSSATEPRRFGMALVWLGIGMLVAGIVYHVQFMVGLRRTRVAMKHKALVHADSLYPVSLTLIAAIALLGIGIAAIAYLLS